MKSADDGKAPRRKAPGETIARHEPKDLSASVRQRLTDLARSRGIEFQRVLVLYSLERLLYRLSVSSFAECFVLKGASLFLLWLDEPHRMTRDVDLLAKNGSDRERLAALFQDLCRMEVGGDGLNFSADTVRIKPIRQENTFGGVRISLTALLSNARIGLQVDIGFGDEPVPEAEQADFPTLLPDFPVPRLMVYQKETTIAEKLHAIVTLERANSRMKDFFDLYVLSREFAFSIVRLTEAVRSTFVGRETMVPTGIPDGLTQDFATDRAKVTQWKAFLKQNASPSRDSLTLDEFVAQIGGFLLPVLNAARASSSSKRTTAIWEPGGPWQME